MGHKIHPNGLRLGITQEQRRRILQKISKYPVEVRMIAGIDNLISGIIYYSRYIIADPNISLTFISKLIRIAF